MDTDNKETIKNTKATTTNMAPPPKEKSEPYPIQIPEAQGDLADRAEIEIEQEIQEQIMKIRSRIPRNSKA